MQLIGILSSSNYCMRVKNKPKLDTLKHKHSNYSVRLAMQAEYYQTWDKLKRNTIPY